MLELELYLCTILGKQLYDRPHPGWGQKYFSGIASVKNNFIYLMRKYLAIYNLIKSYYLGLNQTGEEKIFHSSLVIYKLK